MTPGGYPERACVRCGAPTAGAFIFSERGALCSACVPRESDRERALLDRRIDCEHERRALILETREGRR